MILLIEDQKERQARFMNKLDFSLDNYSDILKNYINTDYSRVSKELQEDSFNFDNYDVIIAHKSAFEECSTVVVSKLETYAQKSKKPLILFSGGVSNYYNNSKYEHLEINSKYFYSENLKLFLDNYRKGNINLLMLSYGDKWVVEVVLKVLAKINLFLDKNNDKDIVYPEFENFTNINELENIEYSFYSIEVDDGWIYRKEVESMKLSIEKYMADIIDE